MSETVSRRGLMKAAAVTAVASMTARSYARVVGANSRIQIGQIGCGHRAAGHRRMLKLSKETDPNFDFRSLELNFEVAVAMSDDGIANALRQQFSADIKKARRINPDEWSLRSPWRVRGENFCRLFAPLL